MGQDWPTAAAALTRSIQTIRLVHAAIRDPLGHDHAWDVAVDGGPIHQEDMLCTALVLSVVVLDVVDRLGVPVTAQDAEDYYHARRVTGAMLGIRADILPETLNEARRLFPA